MPKGLLVEEKGLVVSLILFHILLTQPSM